MNETGHEKLMITDIKMPFWSLVVLMVKGAIASIPAFIILTLVGAAVFTALAGFVGGIGHVDSLLNGMR